MKNGRSLNGKSISANALRDCAGLTVLVLDPNRARVQAKFADCRRSWRVVEDVNNDVRRLPVQRLRSNAEAQSGTLAPGTDSLDDKTADACGSSDHRDHRREAVGHSDRLSRCAVGKTRTKQGR